MEQQTSSKLGKEYIKAVYCHPAYLTYMQSSLCEMPGWAGSKVSILRRSAFFTVQLSHPYMTTGKTIALTRRTFVGKVMSLLLNMLGWS